MRLTKLNSDKPVSVNVQKYKINWSGKSPSKIQKQVKDFLYAYWAHHIVLEEFKVPGSKLRCDFVNLNKKLIIEVNGDQHENFNKFFHKTRSAFLNQIKRDYAKEEWAKQNGFTLINIDEDDLPLTYKYVKKKFGISL